MKHDYIKDNATWAWEYFLKLENTVCSQMIAFCFYLVSHSISAVLELVCLVEIK